jgi:predicted DNA-binding antitoxin AbrB/MazE fold protein
MTTIIEATFDGTVFRPSQPVALEPNTPVRLIVESATSPENKPLSFLDTLQSIKIEGPPDWSANVDKYLYGDLHGED